MKLRIRGDSLRLRLTRGEIDALCQDGRVSNSIHFGPGRALEYVVELADAEAVHARFEGSSIYVVLPRAAALEWANSEQVGMSGSQPVGETVLALLIEKDFQCLAPRGEQDDDAFPNPAAETGATC